MVRSFCLSFYGLFIFIYLFLFTFQSPFVAHPGVQYEGRTHFTLFCTVTQVPHATHEESDLPTLLHTRLLAERGLVLTLPLCACSFAQKNPTPAGKGMATLGLFPSCSSFPRFSRSCLLVAQGSFRSSRPVPEKSLVAFSLGS